MLVSFNILVIQGGGMILYVVDPKQLIHVTLHSGKNIYPLQLSKNTDEKIVVHQWRRNIQATTSGAFPNFGGTNIYKSKQLEQIGEMFCNGEVQDGDYFIYTDAWNHSYSITLYGRTIGC